MAVKMTSNKPMLAYLMYLKKGHDSSVDIDDPTVEQALQALIEMDGGEADTFFVQLRNGESMEVGGGRANQYKCHARISGHLYDLVKRGVPIDVTDTIEIPSSQDLYTYPKCTVVSLEEVRVAVECFCRTGRLSSQFRWDDTLEYDVYP